MELKRTSADIGAADRPGDDADVAGHGALGRGMRKKIRVSYSDYDGSDDVVCYDEKEPSVSSKTLKKHKSKKRGKTGVTKDGPKTSDRPTAPVKKPVRSGKTATPEVRPQSDPNLVANDPPSSNLRGKRSAVPVAGTTPNTRTIGQSPSGYYLRLPDERRPVKRYGVDYESTVVKPRKRKPYERDANMKRKIDDVHESNKTRKDGRNALKQKRAFPENTPEVSRDGGDDRTHQDPEETPEMDADQERASKNAQKAAKSVAEVGRRNEVPDSETGAESTEKRPPLTCSSNARTPANKRGSKFDSSNQSYCYGEICTIKAVRLVYKDYPEGEVPAPVTKFHIDHATGTLTIVESASPFRHPRRSRRTTNITFVDGRDTDEDLIRRMSVQSTSMHNECGSACNRPKRRNDDVEQGKSTAKRPRKTPTINQLVQDAQSTDESDKNNAGDRETVIQETVSTIPHDPRPSTDGQIAVQDESSIPILGTDYVHVSKEIHLLCGNPTTSSQYDATLMEQSISHPPIQSCMKVLPSSSHPNISEEENPPVKDNRPVEDSAQVDNTPLVAPGRNGHKETLSRIRKLLTSKMV